MSKIYENEFGIFISHKKYIDNIYQNVNGRRLQLNPCLFKISCQYNSNKNGKSANKSYSDKHELLRKEQEEIKLKFSKFMCEFLQRNIINYEELENEDALKAAEFAYNESGKVSLNNAFGMNNGSATFKKINNSSFLFPQNSIFFVKDIAELELMLQGKKYDLILLDPPWWNKYIRRKRKKSGDAYKMLYNDDLKNIPIDGILKDDGIVVVWCTNSLHNLNDLITEIFPKWNIEFCGKWYWVKVTTTGKPVCNFSIPPGKQPYEQIIFGRRKCTSYYPATGKLVISVPSSIHSHKPPLVELLKAFLPDNPTCLEIFARYLLPGWTSYGNETLRLQHESLFTTL